jgi:hypothetical protein
MGVKYRAEFQDINAVDWRIDIDEAGYSGSVNTFTVAAPGFTATWEGDGAKVGESPIRASKAVVHWLVKNSTEETFLDTLATSSELKYTILIYQGITPTLWWLGTVLPDLCVFENRYYPYAFDLTATDGLGRLEDFDFTYATNISNTDTPTLGTILTEALKPNKLDTFYGASDVYLRTSLEYYESSMGTVARSPLEVIRARRGAFLKNYDKADHSGLWEPITCKEALEKVLRSLALRIEFSRGSYRIYQHQNYRASTYTEYRYTKTGINVSGYSTSATINTRSGGTWQSSDLKLTSGATYTYFPALKTATVSAERRRMFEVTQATFQTGTKSVFMGDIDTTIPWRITGKVWVESTKAVSRLSITIGRYNSATGQFTHFVRLTEDKTTNQAYEEPGTVKWVQITIPTSSRVGYNFGYNIPAAFSEAVNGKVLVDVDVKIPATATNLGSDIRIYIVAEDYARAYAYGSPTGATSPGTWADIKWQGSLAFEGMADTANQEWTDTVEYVATNTSQTDNSASVKIDGALMDGNKQYIEGVEIYNATSSEWQAGSAWKPYSGYSGSNNALAQLTANYIMAHHWKPCKVLRGEFRDLTGFLFDFVNAVTHDGETFISNGGTFTANDARWNGEWLKYQWDDTVFSTAVKLPSKRDTVGTTLKDIASLKQRQSDLGQLVGGVVSRWTDGVLNQGGGDIGTPTGGDIWRPVVVYNTIDGFKASLQRVLVAGETIKNLTANATLDSAVRQVYAAADSAGIDITLPDASTFPKFEQLIVMKTDSTSNTVKIIAATGDTINGVGSHTTSTQYAGWKLVATGNNTWLILP